MFVKERVEKAPSSMGMEQRLQLLLVYLLGWVGGLVFYFAEKKNRVVRFSAVQSILIGGGWLALLLTFGILSGFPFLGIVFRILNILLGLAYGGACVFLAVMGWKGEKVKIRFIGDIAEKWSGDDDPI